MVRLKTHNRRKTIKEKDMGKKTKQVFLFSVSVPVDYSSMSLSQSKRYYKKIAKYLKDSLETQKIEQVGIKPDGPGMSRVTGKPKATFVQ